jgi:hypothetical protein
MIVYIEMLKINECNNQSTKITLVFKFIKFN